MLFNNNSMSETSQKITAECCQYYLRTAAGQQLPLQRWQAAEAIHKQ